MSVKSNWLLVRIRLTVLMLLIAAVLPRPAHAAEDSDYAFGTKLVIISTQQISMPNYGWWAEKLPMEYSYAVGTIIKTVNEARSARGNPQVIDYKTYPIQIGGELQTDKGWEYNIDFQHMLPEDIDVILAAYPLVGELSDLQTELRPVSTGYFYVSSQDASPVTLDLPGGSLTVEAADGFNATWDRVNAALEQYFGREVKFDLSMNRYRGAAGYNNFDLNVTIYMDDSFTNSGDNPYYAD